MLSDSRSLCQERPVQIQRNDINQPLQSLITGAEANGAKEAGRSNAATSTARSQGSRAGQAELNGLKAILRSESEVRPEVVEAARSKVQQGYYSTKEAAAKTAAAIVGTDA